ARLSRHDQHRLRRRRLENPVLHQPHPSGFGQREDIRPAGAGLDAEDKAVEPCSRRGPTMVLCDGGRGMLTLYYAPGACSMAAHIVLEESGEKYQPQKVD